MIFCFASSVASMFLILALHKEVKYKNRHNINTVSGNFLFFELKSQAIVKCMKTQKKLYLLYA